MAKKIIFHLDKLLEEKGLGQREASRLADGRHATLHQIYHNRIERLPMPFFTRLLEVLDVKDIQEIMEIVDVDDTETETIPLSDSDKDEKRS